MNKVSIILMNLGGPDKPENVKTFLLNLFNDPLIIRLPKFLRKIIAWLITFKRLPEAIKIYEQLGGGSPILGNTIAQQDKLAEVLRNKYPNYQFQFEITMRYFHPFCKDVTKNIKEFDPQKIILVPLYPQFSTTTTLSSINEFKKYYKKENLRANLDIVCCYPTENKFIQAQVKLLDQYIELALKHHLPQDLRILFSAHGLPEKIIKDGDPYQWQVELTTKNIMLNSKYKDIEYINCYQSRVGPVQWIKPYTDQEIIRAGQDKKAVIIIPISFVSEHSETLVELDIEYVHLKDQYQLPGYYRVPTLSVESLFIETLADICSEFIENKINQIYPAKRICNKEFCGCINNNF